MIMKKFCPIKSPDVIIREDEKEALLFHPANGNMICINRTGMLVWELSDGSNTVDDMIAKITEIYEVPGETAEKDCLSYLKELEDSGFLGYAV
jgi:hypothetical protein